MSASPIALAQTERLTPHDLVTYSRCPHEMELMHVRRNSAHSPTPLVACTPLDVVPERHTPLFPPPAGHLLVNDGPLDVFSSDRLIYVDEGEQNVPMLFPPDRIQPDPLLRRHGINLIDDELGLSGRPDLVVRRGNGTVFPVEYKETHVFLGYHDAHFESHGRAFDLLQAIAECRLVQAALGTRPEYGVVWYGDRPGGGQREGWVQVPYTAAEENWLKASLKQIRADRVRAPVPSERYCGNCEPNRDGLCRFAASRFERSQSA